MTSIQVHITKDAQEILGVLHESGCYDGNKARLYNAALEEGLKALVVHHGLSVMAGRMPLNELMAQAFAHKEAGEVRS